MIRKRFSFIFGTLALFAAGAVSASTLTLNFDYDFSDPLDLDSASPDGAGPWATAVFDDGGSAGSVTLTINLFANEVTAFYFNVDDSIGGGSLSIVGTDTSAVSSSVVTTGTDFKKADADGWFDIYIDLPPPGGDRFTAGETLVYTITGAGIVASDFNFQSTPDLVDPNGPFYAAAKFQSTGDGTQSAWVAAVPVPAAVWLFGSALGFLGWTKRRAVISK